VIKSFQHKGLAKLFANGDGRKVQAKHVEKLNLILTLLNAVTGAQQMAAPGLKLHPLKGKMKGRFAVSVDENYRVTFTFKDGHAEEVDYGDYH